MLWMIPLTIVATIIYARQITVGGFSWSDAPLHAMDGVFIHDFLSAMPFDHPRDWAIHYFAKLPCLGIIVYYPPVFACIESLMYFAFGISVVVARWTVVLFAIGALWAMYWVVRQIYDELTAVVAAALLAAMPATVLWTRQVMLEVPTLTMILLAVGFYLQFKRTKRGHTAWLIACASCIVLSILTKQWAAFIVPILFLDHWLSLGWKKTLTLRNVIVAMVASLILFCYVLLTSKYTQFSGGLVKGDNFRHLLTLRNWTYYINALPSVIGWPMTAFPIVGVLLCIITNRTRELRLPLLWTLVFYLFASIIDWKEPRYFYFICAPMAIITAAGLSFAIRDTSMRRAGHTLLLILICWQMVDSYRESPHRVKSFDTAAELISQAEPVNVPKLVLVDANRDGDFVFSLRRAQGADGNVYVLRGSKVLYSRASRARWGYQDYVQSPADILSLIDKYGIRYIVVESGAPNTPDWQDYFPAPSIMLRELLADGSRFERISSEPITNETNSPWTGLTIDVYRYRHAKPRTSQTLRIPVPAMGTEFELAIPK